MPKLRELREEDVEFTIEIQEEDIPVRGHFASGDDQADKEMEDEILSRLERNDLWAWCHVIVRATYKDWTGEDGLGACSYENEADFKVEGGYYSDMKRAALAILNEKLQDAAKDLLPLVEPDGPVEQTAYVVVMKAHDDISMLAKVNGQEFHLMREDADASLAELSEGPVRNAFEVREVAVRFVPNTAVADAAT